jgi:predicted metal-dependent hydrolase
MPARPVVLGQETISLDNQSIVYIIKRSYRARLVWLTYKAESGLHVTVPRNYNLNDLPDFLRRNARWIIKHSRSAKLLSEKISGGLGDSLLLQGRSVPVVRRQCEGRESMDFDGQALTLDLNDPTGDGGRLVRPWLENRARPVIRQKAEAWALRLGVKYERISIRNQRTRWGSCSRLGNLSFNWRLIMVPEPVLDYVVIHELCHLKEMNHQKSFWKQVALYCPQWREQRLWLNRHRVEMHGQFGD